MDLEKAFDRVPREVVRLALRKLGVDEWLIRTVMVLYTEACTVEQMLDRMKVLKRWLVCIKGE